MGWVGRVNCLMGQPSRSGQLGLLLRWAVQVLQGEKAKRPNRSRLPLRRPPAQTSPATCRLLACSFRPTVFALRPPRVCGLQQRCARHWIAVASQARRRRPRGPLPAWLVAYRVIQSVCDNG
ncbi:hypothetical protein PVAP13_4KG378702 [Panicum virgatum]|uniref:Uncharacterized protein n=1 Tax=Panicum virgatum TaxID=38727 RepID=A0A8T0TPX8_PANVG|nr:hypothetical protein PVAP13_4KG378702 [Panicum virgatum]